jgi:hypothetical protein
VRKIKVIVKRADEKIGHVTSISDSLENLQKTVHGYIQAVPLGDGLVMVCNEEGKIQWLPPNMMIPGDYVVGDIIICGVDGEEFCDVPISFSEWKKMLIRWGNT